MNEQIEQLNQLRHSAAHLLAAAILELYPEAKPTIGPAIDNGFYYDFDFGDTKVSEADFKKIDQKMRELVKKWSGFERLEVSADEAKDRFKDNPYKLELIEDLVQAGESITLYKSGEFVDLCRGGHIDNPAESLKHFKLLSVAGAYWRGDEKNKMLTRIYGTAFNSAEDLDKHLVMLEEAKKRDHRKIGKDLNLFTFSDLVGKGLPLFTEKGATIWREIERFVVDEEIKAGYRHVRTPNIAKTDLYKTSGHYPYYKDTMYPTMQIDEDELILRPMTCPHHFALFMDQPRSYRDLPLRYAEMASLYRYEKSGELTGLIRVRSFCLADSHNFVRRSQAAAEVNRVIDLIELVSDTFGLVKGENYRYRLSLGDRNNHDKYYDAPDEWENAENILRGVLNDRQAPYYEAKDEAAFYGPKIDVQMKNVLGKEDTAFTVQYDFCLPTRFQLSYINEQGEAEQPVVIHRSSFGAMERSIGFLIEHFAGAFPLWLSPVQAVVLPIGESHREYADSILAQLKAAGIRAELSADESIGKRIRLSEKQKVPYMLVLGDKEVQAGSVAVRGRGEQDLGAMPVGELVQKLVEEIKSKSL